MKRQKTIKKNRPSLIINLLNLKCSVDINHNFYNKRQIKEIKNIISLLSKDIWIDKTYVSYRKTKYSDAFIKEKSWYDLCQLIIDTDLGTSCSKYEKMEIVDSLLVIVITYLYSCLCKYGYDVQYIEISFKQSSKFKVKYELDNRTSWNY